MIYMAIVQAYVVVNEKIELKLGGRLLALKFKRVLCIVDCGPPVAPQHGSLESYTNTTEGSQVFYSCNQHLVPKGRMRANCTKNGWSPNPADLSCSVGML